MISRFNGSTLLQIPSTLSSALERCQGVYDRGVYFVLDREAEVYLSYDELYKKACMTLGHLQLRGIVAKDKVIIVADDNLQFVISFWACVLGNMIPVPVSFAFTDEHRLKLRKIHESLEQPYLIAKEAALNDLSTFIAKNNGEAAPFSDIAARMIAQESLKGECDFDILRMKAAKEEDIAYLQYSSGSTGEPKGVILTHHNLITNICDIINASCTTEHDSLLSWMPLYHDMGLIGVHLTAVVMKLNQVLLPSKLFLKDPILWLKKASQHKTTQLYSPNFGFHYLLSALEGEEPYGIDLSAVRIIYNGAEPISRTLVERFVSGLGRFKLNSRALLPVYGLAEASLAVTIPPLDSDIVTYYVDRRTINIGTRVSLLKADDPDGIPFIDVGFPIESCQVKICDDSDQDLPEGYLGHIVIRGANVTAGYYNNSNLTERLFTADGWLRTGDLGFMIDDRLTITGRFKNLVIIHGQNYYSQDLENIALEVEGVEAGKVVACSGKDKHSGCEEVLIFVYTKSVSKEFVLVAAEIKRRIFNKAGLVVNSVIPVRKIPKTTSGKTRNFALVEQYYAGSFDKELEKLASVSEALRIDDAPVSLQLCELFYELTGSRIVADEPIVSQGFSSILAIQLASRIREKFGYSLDLQDLFESVSCEALARRITALPRQEDKKEQPGAESTDTLSPDQKMIWLTEEMHHTKAAYNIGAALLLKGDIDIRRLQKALAKVVGRHECLRTYFTNTNGQPVTVTADIRKLTFDIEFHEFAGRPDALATAKSFLEEAVNRPFDLARPPLFHLHLCKLSDDLSFLGVIIHHIISDGWSLSVLFNELMACYHDVDGAGSGEQYRYQDFVKWRESVVASTQGETNMSYWLNELKEVPHLRLPGNGGRSFTRSFEGNSRTIRLPDDLSHKLDAFASAYKISRFMALVSLVDIFLYKYTGQSDFVVGTSSAGRLSRAFEDQIGYFLNLLPLRTTFSSDDSYLDLARVTGAKILDGLKHQVYSIEALMEKVSGHPGAGGALFNVLVLYNDFYGRLSFQALEQKDFVYLTPNAVLTDLQFEFFEYDHSLHLCLRYNAHIFTADFIDQAFRHFITICKKAVDDPHRKIRDIGMLEPAEQRILEKLSLGNRSFRADLNFAAQFKQTVGQYAEAPALRFDGTQLSYNELNKQCNKIYRYLASRYSIGPGARVAVMMNNSANLIACITSFLKYGVVIVPIDPLWPSSRVEAICKECQVSCMMTDGTFSDELLHISILPYSECLKDIDAMPGEEVSVDPSAIDLAYIMYTSGSTGEPKGVMIQQESLIDYILTFKAYFEITSRDRIIQQSSIAFDTFFEETLSALCTGASLCVVKNGGRDIQALIATIRDCAATVVSATPLVIEQLNNETDSLTSVRLIVSGGDELKREYISHLVHNKAIFNTYGPTETTICVAFAPVTGSFEKQVIGKPIANRQIHILDKDFNKVPVGVEGQLCVAGFGLATGYVGKGDGERFVESSLRKGERMYCTGDRARWLPDGNIEFLGREDTQIKWRGYRIELREIERNLCLHPQVKNAVAIDHYKDGNRHIAAFIMGDVPCEPSALIGFLGQRLPYYMIPGTYIAVQEFPRTVQGKIDKARLLRLISEGSTDINAMPPQTDVEFTLKRIWEEVLEKQVSGVTQNFFEAGGNSIRAIKAISRISKEFSIPLGLKTFFLSPTIRGVASVITTSEKENRHEITSAGQREFYPVSNAQRRIWILQYLNPSLTAYHIHSSIRVKGMIDHSSFKVAFNTLVRRHESLRTNFVVVEGEPYQKIHQRYSPVVYLLNVEDEQDPIAFINKRIAWEVQRPFDLEKDRLLRINVFSLSKTDFVISLVIHHIISDGWSIEIMTREFLEICADLSDGREILAAPAPFQYKDYQVWLDSELVKKTAHRDYWHSRFSDDIPVLDLTSDFPRPPVKTYAGGCVTRLLERNVSMGLQAAAALTNTTVFSVFLALVKILLARYSNQREVVVGVPVSGRVHPALESLSGFFVNTLPVRATVSPDSNLQQWIISMHKALLEDYEHQIYPFDKLAEELPVHRDKSRSPFYDVMVVMNDMSYYDQLTMDSFSVEPFQADVKVEQTKFDLSFILNVFQDRYTLDLEYRTDLFRKERIEEIVSHFEILAGTVMENMAKPIGTLDFLPGHEKALLLAFGNIERSDELPADGDTVFKQISESAAFHPDKPAVVSDDLTISYRELQSVSDALADVLVQKFNVGVNENVAVLLPRNACLVISILSVLKTGAAYVPVDPEYPAERLQYILTDCKPKIALIADRAFIEMLTKNNIDYFLVDHEVVRQLPVLPVPFTIPFIRRDQLAYLIYTSGSTGQPKGVRISHGNLYSFIQWCLGEFRESQFDTVFAATSVCFDLSIFEIFFTLAAAKTIRILRSALDIPVYLPSGGRILLNTVPSVVAELVAGKVSFSNVTVLNLAGETIPDFFLQLFDPARMEVRNLYGPSESTTYSTCWLFTKQADRICIGKPISNTQIFILDRDHNLAPFGCAGEIAISGAGLSSGYLHNDELTARKFVHLPLLSKHKVYLTGDMGKWSRNGNIDFLGRFDTQVKVRGFRIELEEIEHTALRLEGIQKAVALVQKHDSSSEPQIVLYYTTSNGRAENDVTDHLVRMLPRYMIPSILVPLDKFPLTLSGKIDKKKLQPAKGYRRGDTFFPPQDEIEKQVCGIWKDVLNQKVVSIEDNFFDLGGNSLNVIRLSQKIDRIYPNTIKANEIFNCWTVRQQSNLIRSRANLSISDPQFDHFEF